MNERKLQIKANRLDRGFQRYQTEFEAKALEVLCGGLDALWLAIRAVKAGQGFEDVGCFYSFENRGTFEECGAAITVDEWIFPMIRILCNYRRPMR